MNIDTNPNAQMPAGKARNTPNAAREDGLLFEGKVFKVLIDTTGI